MDNLQTAVLALMMAAEQHQLNNSYTNIDTETEVQGIMAGTKNPQNANSPQPDSINFRSFTGSLLFIKASSVETPSFLTNSASA
jgi:hypothetical protein